MTIGARADTSAAERLRTLATRLHEQADFAAAVASLEQGHGATFDGVWGSSRALITAALLAREPEALVVIAPGGAAVDSIIDDLPLFSARPPASFPAAEATPDEERLDDEVAGERLRVLKRLSGAESALVSPFTIVSSIQALLQPVPSPEQLRQQTRTLEVGKPLDVQELLTWLAEAGFRSMSAVELPGEFSLHGGILDLFSPDAAEPLRVELFGDEIESLRRFDVGSQRSLAMLQRAEISLPERHPAGGHLIDYLPERTWFLLVEPSELQEEAGHYLRRVDHPEAYHSFHAVMQQVLRFPSATASAVAASSMEETCRLKVESIERFSGDVQRVRDELDTVGESCDVTVVVQSEAEAHRLTDVFAETKLAASGRLQFVEGHLSAGFRLIDQRLAIVGSHELFHREERVRPVRRHVGRAIDSFLELREGDYVVHLAHGIGRYRGLEMLTKEDQVEEHLELEFHGGTKVYVPTTRIELVQKYVGPTKSRPTLARIGGRSWLRQKQKAQAAVIDLATEMLDVQAARSAQPGIAFPADTDWQSEFDAAFPYPETGDQLSAIDAIKNDMALTRPMDRLLCGDVGYGKTEVAMRAIFKAVDSGYQVAILVPTTVLAEQHGRTLHGRMAEYPFEIAVLSRFRSRKEQAAVIEGLKAGTIDVVVGTHRLAQHDVQFQNLGLIVIDEEQRFGVDVKERLKALRTTVDVLTLTATPIPRTLHMSLLGLRDISNLETPPEDRLAVETRVARFDTELVRHAILRELNRGGQIYFVHNRIQDIETIARKLKNIVPELRLAIGHGQMPESELERVMLDFVEHRFDLLLATTIVESGLDIPNANTIFIDEADRYGLADLHQLRGRVGRYKHRAYCYLLIDPNRVLNPEAAKRLRAIEEFSHMGAGFAIALRDLEIRGAGNILGTQQSGHIAAVGYELYCELLEQAVRRLQRLPPKQTVDVDADLPGEAYLPRSYVADMRLKIDLYRRLARLTADEEVDDFVSELIDRFGPVPSQVERLISLMRIRIAAASWGVAGIHVEDDYLVLRYRQPEAIRELAEASGKRLRIVDDRSAYLPLTNQLRTADVLHEELKSLLRPR